MSETIAVTIDDVRAWSSATAIELLASLPMARGSFTCGRNRETRARFLPDGAAG